MTKRLYKRVLVLPIFLLASCGASPSAKYPITKPPATGLASIAKGDPTRASVDSAFFKVVNVVEFKAPVAWVWKNWPLNFKISKVMTDDVSGRRPTIGVTAQRAKPAPDGTPFNVVGSSIHYWLVGGREVDETVLQRDNARMIYEYVYSLGFADAQGHMKFEASGPNTSQIVWTYWIKPKSDAMKERAHKFLNEVWGPFITNHCTPNLKAAVDGLYSGDSQFLEN